MDTGIAKLNEINSCSQGPPRTRGGAEPEGDLVPYYNIIRGEEPMGFKKRGSWRSGKTYHRRNIRVLSLRSVTT